MRIYNILFEGYYFTNDNTSAIECGEKLLDAVHGFDDRFRDWEGSLAMCLATLYKKQRKAKELFEKALDIKKATGDRCGEAKCYMFLGGLFYHLGKYNKLKEYVEKALRIYKEISHRQGVASCYGMLGSLFKSLDDYDKAKKYFLKALSISKEIGDRQGEATNYINLGGMFGSIGEYVTSEEYLQKALVIHKEIGNRKGEASCYNALGVLFNNLSEHAKAIEYHKKSLFIAKEIDREGEAPSYLLLNLGVAHLCLGECAKAKQFINKAITTNKEIGDVETEFHYHLYLATVMMYEGNTQEAISNLFYSIQKCEDMRSFLRDNDQFNVLLLDKHFSSYQILSWLFCATGNPSGSLCIIELGRARALTDLMSTQYFVGEQITMNPQSWVGLERIIKKMQ